MSTPEKETTECVVVEHMGSKYWRSESQQGHAFAGQRAIDFPVGTKVTLTITLPPAPELPTEEDLRSLAPGCFEGSPLNRLVAAYRNLREKARAGLEVLEGQVWGRGETKIIKELRAALGEGRE